MNNQNKIEGVSIETTTVNSITDESLFHMDDMQSVDGGDHQVNIWKDDAGKMKISIQGTGEGVTLLTLDSPHNRPDFEDLSFTQWAGDDYAAMSAAR